MKTSTSTVNDGVAKILLVKSDRQETKAWAFVLSGEKIYTRCVESERDIEAVIADESFQLVIDDARGHSDAPFLFIEKFRRHQPHSPLVLLCPALEFEAVVQAIRLGVNDILVPPFDFKALQERAVELMRTASAARAPNVSAARWFEIVRVLAEPAEADEHLQPEPPRRRRGPPADEATVAALRAERDRLAADLQSERKARAAADQFRYTLAAENEAMRGELARIASMETDPRAIAARLAAAKEAEAALAVRQQALAVELVAQEGAARQLAEERDRLAAERQELERTRKSAEDALEQTRTRLERERRAFELMARNEAIARERRDAELAQHKAALKTGSVPAADAASAAPLAQRPPQLDADQQQRAAAEHEKLAGARAEIDRMREELARHETEFTERQRQQELRGRELAQIEKQLEARRIAAAQAEAARHQQDIDLQRRCAEAGQREAVLHERESVQARAEAEIMAARDAAAAGQEALTRARTEADAELARIGAERESLARLGREQCGVQAELDRRTAALSEQLETLARERAAVSAEARTAREQKEALDAERAALRAEIERSESLRAALAQREQAFEARRQQLRQLIGLLTD